MTPIVGILYTTVESNYTRLKSIVANMSQEELDYKGPNENDNSTAQLIRHLAYVDLNWVYRMKGESIPKLLEEKYGPMLDENHIIPLIYGVPLQKLLSDYDKVFTMFTDVCMELTDEPVG
jgi:hypothetical protein